jgi:RNA polymerase sigma-70 factor, ECF subfamily
MNAVAVHLSLTRGSSVPAGLARSVPAGGAELPALLRRWVGFSVATGAEITSPFCEVAHPRTWTASCQGKLFRHALLAETSCVHAKPLETCSTSAADPTDWADVQASLRGDGEAYARLVRRYQPPIAATMWRFTRDRRQWEELVHDVFVEAYLSLARYAGRAPLLHWLKRIATRVGYRYWQVRQRRQREVPLPTDTDPSAAVMVETESARHAGEVVQSVLHRLAPRDRLVMTLTYLEGCSVAQVAQLTGWTQTMVKVQTHRARKRLAKICKQMGIEL